MTWLILLQNVPSWRTLVWNGALSRRRCCGSTCRLRKTFWRWVNWLVDLEPCHAMPVQLPSGDPRIFEESAWRCRLNTIVWGLRFSRRWALRYGFFWTCRRVVLLTGTNEVEEPTASICRAAGGTSLSPTLESVYQSTRRHQANLRKLLKLSS
jgi:hypothetical protein